MHAVCDGQERVITNGTDRGYAEPKGSVFAKV